MEQQNKIIEVQLSALKPYWRNPNRGNVASVKASIQQYGYNQFIIVDPQMVIIVGHTRYKALQELGYTTIKVIVANLSEKKAKEYRIVDNKTRDLASWDMTQLSQELREIGDELSMQQFFSVDELQRLVQNTIGVTKEHEIVDQQHVDKQNTQMQNFMTDKDAERKKKGVDVICPQCAHSFKVEF